MYYIAEHICGYYLGDRGKIGGIWQVEPRKKAKRFPTRREVQRALDNLPDYFSRGFTIQEVKDEPKKNLAKAN